ncbi:MAG: hypothetical protein QGD96_11180 [Anaerolineae bacterium]|nr:hypothetical protein [Anaerolineae bacterium]
MEQKILILGGYGNAGFLIGRLLLQESNVQLVISGRNLSRAKKAADELNRAFNTNRVSGKRVDAYVLTAVPVVACLLQYLNGNIRRAGLWFQANLVEPKQFFDDIERLGVGINVQFK